MTATATWLLIGLGCCLGTMFGVVISALCFASVRRELESENQQLRQALADSPSWEWPGVPS